ncbi:hypothetical protein RZ532_02600 [Nitratireductor aquimarinus]|uniref:DUF7507 domain-containing protein n=1 Tax=Nitratireductor aquimarinus TaxID=889300 RepID=UPI002935F360|nr:hypothetical protein [Nitratireductor aquimarinus]MDV2964848.1 hypothetical protein [Nitratireductor aquimarinus]
MLNDPVLVPGLSFPVSADWAWLLLKRSSPCRRTHIGAGTLSENSKRRSIAMTARRLVHGHLRLIVLAFCVRFAAGLSRQAQVCIVISMIALLGGVERARAVEGLGVSGTYYGGLIGSNKGHTSITQCPAGTFLRGVRHTDHNFTGTSSTHGMTVRVDLYCSRVTTDGTTINLEPLFTVNGYAYPRPGSIRVKTCPAGMIARAFYGRHRSTASVPWTSQVGILCTKLELKAGQWIHFNTASNSTRLDAGVIEGNAVHYSRGGFCLGSDDRLFAGYAPQRGGAGYDGIRAYCGYFAQARLSATIAFSDFAWDTTIGGSGWNTALAQGGTALPNGAAADVYALPGDNDAMAFQSAHELYVTPASNYGALVNQRPTGINATTYVETGSCAGGNAFALVDEQDGTCGLTINGLPDIGVSGTAPASSFTGYGVAQNFTMTATNHGPGATDGDDGFTLVATLPAGWSTSGTLPAGCTESGAVVTCSLNATALAASSGPGVAGGTVSFAIPVAVNLPAMAGDYSVSVVLGRSAPDGDADATNNDFNTGNDSASVPLSFPAAPSLSVLKTSVLNSNGTISYTFKVENTGNVTLSNVTVTDTRATLTGGPIATLAPGVTDATTITGYYDVTQADIDSGSVDNLASMSAKDPKGNPVEKQSRPPGGTAGGSTEFEAEARGALDIVKVAVLNDVNDNGYADKNETIDYRFTVTNTGNVTLSEIAVEDSKAEITGSPIVSLAPGDSDTSVTGSYTIRQADIDAGSFENVATATGKDPHGETVTAQSRPEDGNPGEATVIRFKLTPLIELDLVGVWIDTDKSGFPDPTEPVKYTFTVRNTGNETVENITINTFDVAAVSVRKSSGLLRLRALVPVSGGTLPSLAPGDKDSSTFSASYLLTQSDIDAGKLIATAQTVGVAVNGTPVSDISDDPHDFTDVDTEGDEEPDDPTVTVLPQKAALALMKTGEFQGSGEAIAQPGDTILYTFTVTNDGNVSLSDVTPVDVGPRFNERPAKGRMSSFSPPGADLGAGESAVFTATYTLTQGDIAAAQGVEDGVKNTATASATGPQGQSVTAPEAEGVVELPGYAVSKTTALGQVRRGSRVPYTIRVKMLGVRGSSTVNVVDMTPPGLVFAPGSARLGDTAIAPVVAGRKLVFNDIVLKEGEAVEITLELLVTSAAKPGEYVNRAWVEDLEGTSISRIATAAVEVIVETVFDCGDIIGRAFDDRNRNGYQDKGEPGLAGVRVATVKGLLVTADAEGRFHIPCADLPDQRIGTNYILKLDTRSLPSGYRLTTENPRVVRLTAGKASRFLFGASVGRVMRLDLSDAAFEEGGAVLRPEWQSGIARMIELLNKEPSSLRLVYTETGEGQRLAQKRIKAVRKGIASEWRRVGARYRLDIEIRVQAFRALPDRPQSAFGYR